ncbi:MAG: response regulator [Pirellulaceae bacterium]|nr:response regulator [Pirellulaceae bacterium]
MFDEILDVLALFVGGRNGSQNNIVRFGLAAMFWGPLFAMAWTRRQTASRRRERLLVVGFSLGLARECFMLAVALANRLELADPGHLHVVFPPLEHALSLAAVVVVAAAFWNFLLPTDKSAWRFLRGSLLAVTICYLATFWWWAQFIIQHPELSFGKTWCDVAFRVTGCCLLVVPISVLWRKTSGWLRNAICLALSCFLLSQFLKLVDIALEEQFKTAFSPIRHAFEIFAIPIFAYVYVRERSEERYKLELESRRLERQMLHEQKLNSLGVLSGGIAHDFNNILTVILGFASVARVGLPPDHNASSCLDEIESAGQRAARLTKQMLAYAGKGGLVQSQIDLSDLVTDMTALLRAAVPKKIEFETEIESNPPVIVGDVSQIEQVVLNLVTNASESIGDSAGSIRLKVSCRYWDADHLARSQSLDAGPMHGPKAGNYVAIEVRDNGCGMDDETAVRLFEPFYTTKFTGRGLGLAAVLGIVRQHGGALLLDTRQGLGSRFRVLFPTMEDASPTDNESSVSDFDDNHIADWLPDASEPRGYRVLVVDDEPQLLSQASKLLRSVGFDVVTAGDGREAIATFVRLPEFFDCVVLDMTMPVMDGRQTLDVIRAIRRDSCVLLTSGYSEQSLVGELIDGKRTQFIQKPYESVDFVARVVSLCKRNKRTNDVLQNSLSL